VGLTLIRKSTGAPKANPKVALVLAGGAVSGGAFKVGGLKALDDYLTGRGMTDLDIYVGLSAGAILAIPLAGGLSPEAMMGVLDGSSEELNQLRPTNFYSPNWREFIQRPSRLVYDLASYLPGVTADWVRGLPSMPDALGASARRFMEAPTYAHFEALATRAIEHTAPRRGLPSLTDQIPSGLFDNASLELWMRQNLERIGMPNDFRAFQRRRGSSLYLSACDLDTAERVIFGADENSELTISQAMQASTALPVFYKPARLNGIDYVDGGVRHTANIDVAIEKGADLIICYNPFRPFLNRLAKEETGEHTFRSEGGHLSDRGLKMVVNQVFRTLLHSRLKLGLQRYLNDTGFQGDIVLLEPPEHDSEFFSVNPLAFWRRSEAMQHGFESVRSTIEQNFSTLSEVFAYHGLELDREVAAERANALWAERGWAADTTHAEDGAAAGKRLHLVGA
jgi:NTE family protein